VADVVAEIPLQLPTITTEGFDDIQKQIASILESIDAIPFDTLSTDLSQSLTELTALTQTLNNTLSPELVQTLNGLQGTLTKIDGFLASSDALPGQLDNSLEEVDKAVRATRALIDELRAQPNSIIFGEPASSYSRETLGETP
jgi:paraquat-inducible protein B